MSATIDKGKGVSKPSAKVKQQKFSIFHFPPSILEDLRLSPELNRLASSQSKEVTGEQAPDDVMLRAFDSARIAQPTCHTCGGEQFDSAEDQRLHFKTAWHRRNFARKMEWRKKNPDETAAAVGEYPWTPLSRDDDDNETGAELSDVDEDEDDEDEDDRDAFDSDLLVASRKRGKGGSRLSSGLLWFVSGSSEGLDMITVYGVHRRILVAKGTHGIHIDAGEVLAELKRLQLPLAAQRTQAELKQQKKLLQEQSIGSQGPSSIGTQGPRHLWGFVALDGGHFAGAIIDTQTGEFVAHKTFVRYTTRRKQGGSQSRQDNAMGFAANSAGAQIRRYNEQKLQDEIHQLMDEWRLWLKRCELVLVRVPRPNRQNFFGPASAAASHPLRWDDPRIREVPVPMARPSLAELRRVYADVTTVSVANVRPAQPKKEKEKAEEDEEEEAVVGAESGSESDSTLEPEPRPDLLAFLHHVAKMIQDAALTDEDIVAYLCEHLEQLLDALSDPALGLRYLTTTDTVQAHRTPTLLHVASLFGRAELVPFLLDNGEDPTVTSGHPPLFAGGVTAYEIAKDRRTRDVFRVYRSEHEGELDGVEWVRARVPPALTREQVKENEEREKAKKKKEKERKKIKDRERREALERERAAAEADNEALELAMASNREKHSGNGLTGLTDAQLRARMLSMAYASAGSWGGANVTAPPPVVSERPVSPATQRAIDRELRFQAAARRQQGQQAAPAVRTNGTNSAAGCTHCNKPLHGLVPFEQFDWQCCSLQCLHGHQMLYGTTNQK
ncbi:hypothetical protein GGI08_000312 [Coemansia sp. S2]|nr:hypothetical protein GGI08_000312 [Coemansia sp. S2]KAJ2074465.1 hypothetical protein GGH13_001311 [Coemansia sp. S155-1]